MFRLALAVVLAASPAVSAQDFEAAPITVTAKPRPSKVLTAPASVTVVTGRELERGRGQSVMQTIQDAPGVSMNTTGAGIAKPVVRGLTSQRVLTLTDGMRQEGQQWGDEHGPEIDSHGVDRIEIVRGPQSLLYGPEALSGVINVIRRPLKLGQTTFKVGGVLALDGFSHNDQGAASLELRGEGRGAGVAVRASGRSAGDIRTPKGRLVNSGMDERDTGASVGAKLGEATLLGDFSRFEQKLQIHDDPIAAPGNTAFQRVDHEKAMLRASSPVPFGKLEAAGGWQRNERREFESATDGAPALNLVLHTFNGDLKFHHDPIGPLEGTVGVSGMTQRNDSRAPDERLIPGYNSDDMGGFLFEELPLGPVTLSAGARYDQRRMQVTPDEVLAVAAQTKRYSSVSGAFGASWAFTEGWALVGNVGTGWRAPSAFELFVNGEHEGTGRFEVGRGDLRPERSVNMDASIRRRAGTVEAEVTAFRNRVNHFIFARPTGAVDAGSGLPIFNIAQANATLIGAEAAVKWQAREWMGLNAGADFLRAQNDELLQPLPQMPANRVKWGVRLSQPSLGSSKNPYLSASGRLVARQKRTAANEAQTAGYGLVDFGAGAEVPMFGADAHADFGIENAFDLPYRDHLSRYRAYALNAGRSFTLKLTVPFGG